MRIGVIALYPGVANLESEMYVGNDCTVIFGLFVPVCYKTM